MANLLDLDRRSFLMALDELGIQGARRDDLIRQYRTRSAGLLAPAMEFGAVEPGRVRADVLPMTRPEGMTGWEAIRSGQAEFALPGLLAGLVSGAGSAFDAPRAAMAGLIPASDMASEAAGTAGMVTLGGVGGAGRQAFEYDPRAGTLYSNPVPGLMAEGGGIRAYHGSPHTFERFDMSKIGTGEGAQAYGHGLYFAENEGVARGYRDALSGASSAMELADYVYDLDGVPQAIKQKAYDMAITGANQGQIFELIKSVDPALETQLRSKLGRLYEVRIDADPEDFLDWDRPLSEQSEKVRRALNWTPEAEADYLAAQSFDDAAFAPIAPHLPPLPATGADVIMGNNFFPGASAADRANALRQAGVPGIRYLDAGSRNPQQNWRILTPEESTSGRWVVGMAPNGPNRYFDSADEAKAYFEANKPPPPTRNYVVFDDRLISIVRMYGIAGAAALLGMSVADVEAALAAQPAQQPAPRGLFGEQ